MFFPKTGELETFWTNYTCTDPNCPGKRSKAHRDHSPQKLYRDNIDRLPTPRAMKTGNDERHLKYSPGHWNHDAI